METRPRRGAIEEREMTATAAKKEPIAGIAVPIVATLAVAGIAIASRAVGRQCAGAAA